MKLYILPLFLFALSGTGQTNLVPNGSFERLNQEVFNDLNNAANFYDSHFGIEGGAYGGEGLFECCWYAIGHITSQKQGIQGYTWAIAPGLFTIANGSGSMPDNPYAIAGNEVDYTTTPPRILQQNANSYLPLNYNSSNQTYGFDLSPPNTYFGENVTATDGTNYVALFDVENETFRSKPQIACDLKYDLAKGIKYKFSIDFAKMNLLGYIKDQGLWQHVRDGNLKVWVCDHDYNHKQRIMNEDVESNDWTSFEVEFIADRSSNRLIIEYDPISWGGSNKIGGAFIDHLKLYESCETPDIQCVNANYRRDLLDPKLEDATLESPYAFSEPGSNDPGRFKTVRAYFLENVKHLEIDIFPYNVPIPCRSVSIDYPHSEYYWDGRDDNGDLMPEGHYIAIIKKVTNDYFINIAVDTREFNLQRNYSVFNVWASTNGQDGNSFINGLNNVHFVNVKMYDMDGSLVHEFNLNNPPSSIGLSIPSLEAFGGVQNGELAPAYYDLVVTVSNNCTEQVYGFANANFGSLSDSASISPFYDWSSVTKPTEFACPFDFDYNHNVLSPMNCCEGYLHLENMEVWNSWGEINIQDSILLGPNVVFEPGTSNYLNAGQQIVFIPDSSGVVVLGTGVFKPNTFECVICKNYTLVSDPGVETEESEREIVNANESAPIRSEEMIVYPNPAKGEQEITLLAGTSDIDLRNYKLVLSDPLGKSVQVKMTAERNDLLKFKPVNSLSPGSYYLYYESNGEVKTFNLVIR